MHNEIETRTSQCACRSAGPRSDRVGVMEDAMPTEEKTALLMNALKGVDLTSANGRAGIGCLLAEIERLAPVRYSRVLRLSNCDG